jgi:hypothetical protein
MLDWPRHSRNLPYKNLGLAVWGNLCHDAAVLLVLAHRLRPSSICRAAVFNFGTFVQISIIFSFVVICVTQRLMV